MGLGGPVNRLTRTSTHYTHLDEEACLRVTTGYSQTEGCKLQKINVVESKYCYIVAWSETTLSIYIYIYGKIVIILTAGHFSIDAVCQLCTKTLTQNIFVCRIHSSLVPPWSGWTSRQDFFHLQAGVWELCISYMLRSAEKPRLHFCMQFTKAYNQLILLYLCSVILYAGMFHVCCVSLYLEEEALPSPTLVDQDCWKSCTSLGWWRRISCPNPAQVPRPKWHSQERWTLEERHLKPR